MSPVKALEWMYEVLTRRDCFLRGTTGVAAMQSLAAQDAYGEEGLLAAVPGDVLADYGQFIGTRDPLTLTDFGGPFSRRDVVEVVLLQQALRRGGWTQSISLVAMPSAAKLIREVDMGTARCSATSFWRDDVTASGVHCSESVIEPGEFEAGLYTIPSNARAMAARNLADVRHLTALSNRSWIVDWRTLEQLGITNLQHAQQWDLMPRMVARGRADFLLAPFQATPDLSLTFDGVRLVPIPKLKIGFAGTRHFLVSRKHAQAEVLLKALNTGLLQLRRKGLIRQAYVQSGFFNTQVAHWALL